MPGAISRVTELLTGPFLRLVIFPAMILRALIFIRQFVGYDISISSVAKDYDRASDSAIHPNSFSASNRRCLQNHIRVAFCCERFIQVGFKQPWVFLEVFVITTKPLFHNAFIKSAGKSSHLALRLQ
jgi:hypothetical protein